MLGLSGLLQLLTWVEQRRVAQASQHEEGGVPCPVFHPTQSPPPNSRQAIIQWGNLPQANRQRLLWLLSQLLERQMEQCLVPGKEVSDERDDCAE
ncbi:hypothetical protein Krac_9763 [Ktedonobacter racemifer DSM 44963]|uniref:Uncharacterized protein n=2 Tax=Ktedonobacter racemifer TaxID=363277 RepID=D6TDI4_KTERA|nr:hypothetical protein Krac_9763 [Ktedonobacter racemifer DSM 44963]